MRGLSLPKIIEPVDGRWVIPAWVYRALKYLSFPGACCTGAVELFEASEKRSKQKWLKEGWAHFRLNICCITEMNIPKDPPRHQALVTNCAFLFRVYLMGTFALENWEGRTELAKTNGP